MLKASIVITAYNSAKYIRESILSASNQTEKDIEIIVVDDGSADETVTLAKDLSKSDARIKVYPRAHHGKPSITRNAGMRLAKGKYICFLDADDRYEPDKVKHQLDILEANPDFAAAFHDMRYMNERGECLDGTFLREVNFLEISSNFLTKHHNNDYYVCDNNFYKFMSLNYAAIHTSTIMVRRSLIEQERIIFPEDVRVGEDTQVWWLIATGRQIAYINKVFSHYRLHDSSVTKDKNKVQFYKDVITVNTRNYERCANFLDKHESARYRKKIAEHFNYLGYSYFLDSQHKKARQCYLDANRWFLNKGSIFALLKTFIPVYLIQKLKQAKFKKTF